MWRAALADQQLDNIKVVVMDGHVQRGQAILRGERGSTWPRSATADCHLILEDEHWDIRCSSWWITFPAALGLAPLSKSSSATSTFPYLHATWRGVNPFCKKTQINILRMQVQMCIFYCHKLPFIRLHPVLLLLPYFWIISIKHIRLQWTPRVSNVWLAGSILKSPWNQNEQFFFALFCKQFFRPHHYFILF